MSPPFAWIFRSSVCEVIDWTMRVELDICKFVLLNFRLDSTPNVLPFETATHYPHNTDRYKILLIASLVPEALNWDNWFLVQPTK